MTAGAACTRGLLRWIHKSDRSLRDHAITLDRWLSRSDRAWSGRSRSTPGSSSSAIAPSRCPSGFTIERGGRPAAGRPADHGRLRRAGAALRRRLVGLERQRPEATRRAAAPDRPARGPRRRRQLRHAHRLRRQDDVPRRDDVARRLALRRGPAEHLEADRHRRRRRGRPAGRVVPGQDAHRLRQRPARPLPRPRRLDLLVQGGLRPADLRAARARSRSSPARRTSSAAGPTAPASSR